MMRASFIIRTVLFLVTVLFCSAGPVSGDIAGSPYDRHIMYQALVLFWIGIIGLIIIIIIKLREIRRTEDMDVHGDDENAPFLD